MAATFERANTYVFAEPIIRDREVGGSNPLTPTNNIKHLRLRAKVAVRVLWQDCADPIVSDSHRFHRSSPGSVSCVRISPRGLRIRVSHQIGNRRFTATRFRKSGPEGVTQIVPVQVFNPR